jgi:hypothetical protein
MSKSRIAAAVVAMALVGTPVMLGASAASAASSTGTSDTSPAPSFTVADHDEDEDEADEESGHSEHHGVIPPVVIRPHQEGDEYGEDDGDEDDEDEAGGTLPPMPGATPTPGATEDPTRGEEGFVPAYNQRGQFVVAPLGAPVANGDPGAAPKVSKIDPQSAPAISMQGVKPATKTPSDIFMESATVGLTAMGVGAIALGGVAGVRAIRLRRNPTGDYFYESEK